MRGIQGVRVLWGVEIENQGRADAERGNQRGLQANMVAGRSAKEVGECLRRRSVSTGLKPPLPAKETKTGSQQDKDQPGLCALCPNSPDPPKKGRHPRRSRHHRNHPHTPTP